MNNNRSNGNGVSFRWLAGILLSCLGALLILYGNVVLANQNQINEQHAQTDQKLQAEIDAIMGTLSQHTALLFLIADKLGINQSQLQSLQKTTQ